MESSKELDYEVYLGKKQFDSKLKVLAFIF